MGNKHAAGNRNNLQHQNSVPATVTTGSSMSVRGNQRRSSEIKYKSNDGPDRPSTNNGGDSSVKFNRRRWSSAAVGTTRNNTMKPKRLAPRQRNLIIKSWNKTAKTKVGKDIFMAIFNEAEELKQIFGICPHLKGKKLRMDPKFISHTDLFIDTFDFVIRNLDDISMVVENAEQLGKKHAIMNIENFRPEYWTIFTECIVETVADSNDKETQIAWRQLVLTLIFYMKLGYERESLRITRNAQGLLPSSRNCTPSTLNPDIPVL
ncbi:hypothetical protein FO519_006207 [Halicephalobus sp. NKZ332]|nr:hypothetical protein FO519_006207 [Halicephalobus sp. NKZ332]